MPDGAAADPEPREAAVESASLEQLSISGDKDQVDSGSGPRDGSSGGQAAATEQDSSPVAGAVDRALSRPGLWTPRHAHGKRMRALL